MLVNLTINEEGIKNYYKELMQIYEEHNFNDLKTTYEKFLEGLSRLSDSISFSSRSLISPIFKR